MPFPLLAVGALASAVGSVFSSVSSNKTQKSINSQNIDFQREQNSEDRHFQERMYHYNNEYNSPVQQMARLKAAGLNPHLMYGQGNTGNATMPSTPNQKAPHADPPPPINIGSGIFQGLQNYLSLKQSEAQTSNLESTNKVLDAEIVQKNASTAETLARTAKTEQERRFASELQASTVAQAQANVNNSILTGDKIAQDIASSKVGQKLTMKQIESVSAQINSTNANIRLMEIEGRSKEADVLRKNLETNLLKMGINPNDPTWLRILGQGAQSLLKSGSINVPSNRGDYKLKIPSIGQWFKN